MRPARIGIYGGSFSPPHLGHRRILETFIASESLDTCLVIPTFEPPHKQLACGVSAAARLAMCRLAFGDLPVCVSDIEIARGGKSYTAVTLQQLKKEDNTLVLLCGTDMFLTMDRWYKPDVIFLLAEVVYACRESGEAAEATKAAMDEKASEYADRFGAVCRAMRQDTIELSSSDVRRALERNENTEGMLDPRVRKYIDQWNLYKT